MKRRTKLVIVALVSVLPILAFAQGLVPCTGAVGDECQVCMLSQLISNVIGWLVMILSIVTAIIFMVAGLKLVTSGGNPAAKTAAKKMITNAFIGFVIVLACWLIVDLIMKMLLGGGNGEIGIGSEPGPWNTIQCTAQPVAGSNPTDYLETRGLANGATIAETCPVVFNGPPPVFDCTALETACTAGAGVPTVDTSISTAHRVSCAYPATAYAGSCSAIEAASNPCHPSNQDMINAFGARVNEASVICNKESGGAPVLSRSDICCGRDGSCSGDASFSGGYFQVNILAHADKIPGCNLSSFFSQNGSAGAQGDCVQRNDEGVCTGWSCTIARGPAYNTCISATQDSSTNFAIAKTLYDGRGQRFNDWSWSARRCDVPY